MFSLWENSRFGFPNQYLKMIYWKNNWPIRSKWQHSREDNSVSKMFAHSLTKTYTNRLTICSSLSSFRIFRIFLFSVKKKKKLKSGSMHIISNKLLIILILKSSYCNFKSCKQLTLLWLCYKIVIFNHNCMDTLKS